MESSSHALGLAVLALLAASSPARASVVLTNGSFEVTTGSPFVGLYSAVGWVNTSSPAYDAYSAPSGFENSVPSNGSRYLRLVSDANQHGTIYQDLGTMVAGQTYTITGDVIGSINSVGLTWGATVELASNGATTYGLNGFASLPTIYAAQHVNAVAAGIVGVGEIDVSYVATAGDTGKELFLSLIADPSGNGQDIRGGIDNLQLNGPAAAVPEPASMALLVTGLACTARTRSKRQNHPLS